MGVKNSCNCCIVVVDARIGRPRVFEANTTEKTLGSQAEEETFLGASNR